MKSFVVSSIGSLAVSNWCAVGCIGSLFLENWINTSDLSLWISMNSFCASVSHVLEYDDYLTESSSCADGALSVKADGTLSLEKLSSTSDLSLWISMNSPEESTSLGVVLLDVFASIFLLLSCPKAAICRPCILPWTASDWVVCRGILLVLPVQPMVTLLGLVSRNLYFMLLLLYIYVYTCTIQQQINKMLRALKDDVADVGWLAI